MREDSREPTLRDTARWLGQDQEQAQPHWLDQAAHDVLALDTQARVRLIRQAVYLRRIGVTPDAAAVRRMIDEAAEHVTERPDVEPAPEPVTVYYLRIGALIKIGQTRNLAIRLHAYPPGTVVLATETGPRDVLEAQRHAQFITTRIGPYRREWFHPSAQLVDHINSLRPQPLTAAELAA